MIGDERIGLRRPSVAGGWGWGRRRRFAGTDLALRHKALGIEYASTDADIPAFTDEIDDHGIKPRLAQYDAVECRLRQLAVRRKPAVAIPGQHAGLKIEGGDGGWPLSFKGDFYRGMAGRALWLLPLGELDFGHGIDQ